MYSLLSLPNQAQVVWNEPLMINYTSQQTLQAGLLVLGIFFLLGALMLKIRNYYRNKLSAVNGGFPFDRSIKPQANIFYAGGHHDFETAVCSCAVVSRENSIQIEIAKEAENTGYIETIPVDSLIRIKVQDAFTVKNITAPGVWENATDYLFKSGSRKNSEIAFLVIEWKKNEIRNVVFLFIPGDSAMQQAVIKCNELMDLWRSYQFLQSGLSLQTS